MQNRNLSKFFLCLCPPDGLPDDLPGGLLSFPQPLFNCQGELDPGLFASASGVCDPSEWNSSGAPTTRPVKAKGFSTVCSDSMVPSGGPALATVDRYVFRSRRTGEGLWCG